ncbi:hypothetical protein Tco_0321342 [Tanacetum coccineum]
MEPRKLFKLCKFLLGRSKFQKEILHLDSRRIWRLVDLPKGKYAIGTKWVYRNKKDERGIVIMLEASLDKEIHIVMVVNFLARLFPCKNKKQLYTNSTTEVSMFLLLLTAGQFWNTVTSKTVNSVKQIHAIIDGKAVVISESSGMGSDNILKTQSTTMSNDPLSQEIGSGDRPRRQDTTLRGVDAQTRPETATKTPLLEVNTSGRKEDNMEYHDDLTDFVPPTPYDSPLSGGFLALRKAKTAQPE